MPDDYRYDAGDRVLGADGNYETTPGQADMMIREMQSGVIQIDGGDYGNRAWTELQRGFDDAEDRELLKRYYEEVGQRYVAGGGIKDLEVVVGDADGIDGTVIWVRCFDVMRGREVATALPVVRLN